MPNLTFEKFNEPKPNKNTPGRFLGRRGEDEKRYKKIKGFLGNQKMFLENSANYFDLGRKSEKMGKYTK